MLGRLGARGEGGVGGKLRWARNSVPIYVILALRVSGTKFLSKG